MIATDKYEGHTPAPWEGILSGYFTIEQLDKTDKILMQDAPLLLAEVERLREQVKHIKTELYELLVDYGMDGLWFSMWCQGTFTDETGELHRLDACFRNGIENTQWHQQHLLLVRLAEMIA